VVTRRYDVVVAGAGPVGLTFALLLADRGVRVGLLEARTAPELVGSKALCMQRETLEIWDSLGIGEWVADRGVAWSVGRTYFQDTELFSITLPGSTGEHFPPFVNISQSEVEQALARRALAHDLVTIHYGQTVADVEQDEDSVTLHADGQSIRGEYAVAADGSRSQVRRLLGIDFPGHSHLDRFLIADVRADLPFPAERRFWFDPPFNPGRTVLIHPQPDGIWRIDWQVPAEFDLEAEQNSGRLDQRIRQIIGDVDYRPVWLTVYRFQQRCAETWRHQRIFLAGDTAHLMSPFGARGLNSGVADAANLAWKVEHVLAGQAPDSLLDSYAAERVAAAEENLAVTGETMRFMAPPTDFRAERDRILRASRTDSTARAAVNSGRLATPMVYSGGLFPADREGDPPLVGRILEDVPTADGSRLRRRLTDAGGRWLALTVGAQTPTLPRPLLGLADNSAPVRGVYAPDGAARCWLIRPDGYVAACTEPNAEQVRTAWSAATGNQPSEHSFSKPRGSASSDSG